MKGKLDWPKIILRPQTDSTNLALDNYHCGMFTFRSRHELGRDCLDLQLGMVSSFVLISDTSKEQK